MCAKVVEYKTKLIVLMDLHEGVRYPCIKCKYQAASPSNLRSHKKSVHDGLRHKCNQCDYQGYHNTDLKYHILNKHEGMTFSCNCCEHRAT